MEDNLNGRQPTEDDLYSIQQKLWKGTFNISVFYLKINFH
jgi:hypothetical protein